MPHPVRTAVVLALSSLARVASATPDEPALRSSGAPLPPLPPASAPPQAEPPPSLPRAAPTAQPPRQCPCERGCDKCEEPKVKTPGSGVVGVRGQGTQIAAPSGDSGSFGASFSLRAEGHDGEEGVFRAGRVAFDLGLGGGTGDVEGLIGGALLLGIRLPLTRNHAPFLRLGFSGEYQGNSRYLYSRFDLPLGEIGYQFVDRGSLFEVGGRVSPVLTGRLRGGLGPSRVLSSSFSAGAFLTARNSAGRLDLLYTRIQAAADAPGRPVDTLQGLACFFPGRIFALCVDAQLFTTTAFGRGGTFTDDLRAFTVGFTVGFGGGVAE